jgi:hypothetical protein
MHVRYTSLAVLAAALLLSACSSKPEVVPSSGPRSPTSADQVKILQKEPKRYEKLGMVTVSRDEGASWSDKGDATVGFDILKRKAAALGANGLLLKADAQHDQHRMILAGYHDEWYQVPVTTDTPPKGMAQAIHVLSEK